ncbi:MAG TPA: protein adenylyltransferase SelO family protein, partial [Vicingaceae bacterium]|nr:protein adenylyltransferase SelO family protein [Vicingaceae bacterium]
IAGETFDYGPCAFMNAYHPDTVFSSIDTNGRYAFGQQPSISHWNLACLAETLLPLIDENAEKAMELAQNILNQFPDKYHANWWKLYANKLGFLEADTEVKSLIQELLTWMQKNKADYTNTFLFLNQRLSLPHQQYYAPDFEKWMQQREKLLHQRKLNTHVVNELMNANNPCYVPRNHLVEKVLDAACLENNFEEMTRFLSVLATPYNFNENLSAYQEVPKNDEGYKTYCGT